MDDKKARMERIKQTIQENSEAGRHAYDGLTTDEISDYNRSMMFGENDAAFPEQAEWSMWVD